LDAAYDVELDLDDVGAKGGVESSEA